MKMAKRTSKKQTRRHTKSKSPTHKKPAWAIEDNLILSSKTKSLYNVKHTNTKIDEPTILLHPVNTIYDNFYPPTTETLNYDDYVEFTKPQYKSDWNIDYDNWSEYESDVDDSDNDFYVEGDGEL